MTLSNLATIKLWLKIWSRGVPSDEVPGLDLPWLVGARRCRELGEDTVAVLERRLAHPFPHSGC